MTATQTTFKLDCGYARGKIQDTRKFRNPASISEMMEWCDTHQHIELKDKQGRWRTVKVNGKVRTWKRDSERIEVPCKYGLYEYFVLTARDIDNVLIPLAR